MPIHRINLRGPWEFEWLEPATGDAPAHGRVKLPSDWRDDFGDRAGRVRFRRHFHEPTGIEPEDSVWLHFTGVGGEFTVSLDGRPLASEDGTPRFEITDALQPTSVVVVEIVCDPSGTDEPLGLYDFVAVEIETPAP